jgi:hypothetical protein
MATIVNNPGPERVVEVERSDTSGWAIAVIILIAVIVGLVVWARYHRAPPAPSSGNTNINVSLPDGNTNTGTNGTPGN